MKCKFSPTFNDLSLRKQINYYIKNFTKEGEFLNDGQRNSIKVFDLEGEAINIKSFKIPNFVNKIAYRFFRRSKAERSFSYALHLLSRNIRTPQPIAFAEEKSGFTFQRSFYVSEQQECDLTYRELVLKPDYPENEKILRAFTRFTFDLHEKDVEFLDHSPGNTLIKLLENSEPQFYLVDLNRMNFKEMDFNARMKNFSRLTPKKEMVEIMANEYASLINKPEPEVFDKMWFYTREFQKKFIRKKRLKKKLKFWKKG
jgi:hypothetical protein